MAQNLLSSLNIQWKKNLTTTGIFDKTPPFNSWPLGRVREPPMTMVWTSRDVMSKLAWKSCDFWSPPWICRKVTEPNVVTLMLCHSESPRSDWRLSGALTISTVFTTSLRILASICKWVDQSILIKTLFTNKLPSIMKKPYLLVNCHDYNIIITLFLVILNAKCTGKL